jgi:hypothetical protein
VVLHLPLQLVGLLRTLRVRRHSGWGPWEWSHGGTEFCYNSWTVEPVNFFKVVLEWRNRHSSLLASVDFRMLLGSFGRLFKLFRGLEGKDLAFFVNVRDYTIEHTVNVFFNHCKVVPFRFKCLSKEVALFLSNVAYGFNEPHLPCLSECDGNKQLSSLIAACVEAA